MKTKQPTPRKQIRKVSEKLARQREADGVKMYGRTVVPKKATPKARKGITPKKRSSSEFARIYGSRARVAFVKSLGCLYCTMVSPFIALGTCGRSDNAHTVTGGTGRKADYTTIVPLCRTHHRMYDCHEKMLGEPAVRDAIKSAAAEVERMWIEHHVAGRCHSDMTNTHDARSNEQS